ncbi:MAG TPA: ABC transporter permease [Candidatus Limnocylindria bacterium]|nr:ABC transporter permease [Candidatus Limnocylindria bacterium]
MSAKWSLPLRRAALIGALFAVWELTTGGFGLGLQLWSPAIVARPSSSLAELGPYAQSGLLWRDLSTTLIEAMVGLVLGIAGGAALGLALGYQRRVAELLEPILVSLNSLPRIAVAPILLPWLGLGIASKIALSFFTVFFVIFFNTYLGVRSVDPELVKVVQVMGGTREHLARFVVLPSVFSWIFAALRTSVSFALTGAVVGEFVGASVGLGYRLSLAAGLLDTKRVYLILLILMVFAVFLVEVAKRVEGRLLRWRPSAVLTS